MKKYSLYLIVVFLGFVLNACVYDFVAPEIVTEIPDDQEISFATDVLPVLTSECASCHNSGGQSPDLTLGNAYQSIHTSKYIDLQNNDPAASLIYTFVAPDASTHSWKHYTSSQAQFIRLWIEQGAKNN
ncbi:hypothetical protein [Mangrovibacterium marinum]|uniref:Cytochrome c domain-containing protein n=1 Tax=Mangrovibacterium marinum TaxID=1639118 RepID=A0A2T5BZP7_9BACT|nr:hypothetical protein [Mangrovibacterium marinum]PTN07743.1 hypothetical protein C8N47_1138 [Mangrovibacterium marinum]